MSVDSLKFGLGRQPAALDFIVMSIAVCLPEWTSKESIDIILFVDCTFTILNLCLESVKVLGNWTGKLFTEILDIFVKSCVQMENHLKKMSINSSFRHS